MSKPGHGQCVIARGSCPPPGGAAAPLIDPAAAMPCKARTTAKLQAGPSLTPARSFRDDPGRKIVRIVRSLLTAFASVPTPASLGGSARASAGCW